MTARFTQAWPRIRRMHVGCVAVALVTITACTSDPAIVAPSSTTPLSTLRPKAPMGVSAAELASRTAVESYTAMWMTMADVAETADWRSPRLSQHATGTALSTISRGIYLDHTNGWVSRGRPALSPSVAGVEPTDKPTRVRITDCGDSTSWLKYDATTGQLVDDDPGGRRAITAVVDKQDNGAWMVSDFAVQELGSC